MTKYKAVVEYIEDEILKSFEVVKEAENMSDFWVLVNKKENELDIEAVARKFSVVR